jgi:hypothetical protein
VEPEAGQTRPDLAPRVPSRTRTAAVSPRTSSRPGSVSVPAARREQQPSEAPAPPEPAPEPAVPVSDEARNPAPAQEVAQAEPARVEIEELTVPADAVIGIRLESPVSSETARVEDRVLARVTRDVSIDGRTAIPSGSTLEGTVTAVQRGGKFKERARLGIRFTSVVLADNIRVPIQTEPIVRFGEPPGGEATSKIGASAVVGAILGAVIGGKKGAAIGTTAGAAGGTAAVMAGSANEATLPAGSSLTVRLSAPAVFQVRHDP